MWITNAPVADVAVVWARTDDGIRGFVVPMATPGVTAQRDHTTSCRCGRRRPARSCSTTCACRPTRSCPRRAGLKAPLSCLTEARFGIAWGALGAARDCLETAIDYAVTREQFGRPIAGFQLTQAKLADMALELQKGYLLALHLARLADAGALRPEQVSVGKLNNVRESLEIARSAARSSAPTASAWNTRSCATPTTWRACSPTRARPRSTSW